MVNLIDQKTKNVHLEQKKLNYKEARRANARATKLVHSYENSGFGFYAIVINIVLCK
jgi:hypothetical protein